MPHIEPDHIDIRTEKIYTYYCPDCNSPRAQHTLVHHTRDWNPPDSVLVTIECPDCDYYTWFVQAKDI